MSGPRPFIRALGSQPGVQLNYIKDETDGVVPDTSDQVVAMAARLTRGRIDRAFRVDTSNFALKTGPAASIRSNALNEAKLQGYESLKAGAQALVIARMTPAAAAKSYVLVDLESNATTFTVASAVPADGYTLAIMDHECLNDGIIVAVHGEQTPVGGIPVVNDVLTLRISDSTGVLRYEFTGSVDPESTDDFGQSNYLPDVIAALTDNIEVVVLDGSAGVITTSDAYGRGTDGKDKWATSGVLTCFTEGGTIYTAADYDRFIDMLRSTMLPFGYLISGGTPVVSFLGKLGALGKEINVPFKWDIPGTMTPEEAIAFGLSVGFDDHYPNCFWAPLRADDPMNGGKAIWGTAGLNAGLSCARNAAVNAKGFAPKNQPVAGRNFPVTRTGISQTYRPSDMELSDLAKSQINPVIFKNFNGGGRYVFTDCLTGAKTQVSYKKLATVAEMSASIDAWVAMYANELLMSPMKAFIKKMNAFLETLFEGAETSEWLVKSKNLDGNAAFAFSVRPSEVRPADLVLIEYWLSYDGVARQVIIQQNLTR